MPEVYRICMSPKSKPRSEQLSTVLQLMRFWPEKETAGLCNNCCELLVRRLLGTRLEDRKKVMRCVCVRKLL